MINGQVSPADLMAYLLYVTTLLASVRRIVEFTEQFQRGMTGIERFAEVMDAPIEIQDAPNAQPLSHVTGRFALRTSPSPTYWTRRMCSTTSTCTFPPDKTLPWSAPRAAARPPCVT